MTSPLEPYVPASKSLREVPAKIFQRMLANGTGELISGIRAEISPDLTGVGYIIGPRVGGYLLAGGAILGMGIAALQTSRKDESFTVTHWLSAGVTSVTENAVIAIAA